MLRINERTVTRASSALPAAGCNALFRCCSPPFSLRPQVMSMYNDTPIEWEAGEDRTVEVRFARSCRPILSLCPAQATTNPAAAVMATFRIRHRPDIISSRLPSSLHARRVLVTRLRCARACTFMLLSCVLGFSCPASPLLLRLDLEAPLKLCPFIASRCRHLQQEPSLP